MTTTIKPDPTLTAIDWAVEDSRGTFHGQLVNVWVARSFHGGEDYQMFTFVVTGVGFGYSDIIGIGDSWTIVAGSIRSMRPVNSR